MNNPDSGYYSIFDNSKNKDDVGKNPDDVIETKMTGRADALKTAPTYEDYKEDTVEREARLRKDDREKRFRERRLQQQIKVEVGQGLQDHMTIAKDIWDECNKMKVKAEELPNFIAQFKSSDIKSQYVGLVGIRKILALPNFPPIQEVIDAGLVFDFIKYLDHSLPEFQFEALWCLTNIASGTSDHTQSVVNKGGIEKIITLMDSNIHEIQEQAVWAIGNIASDSIKTRDKVIQKKGLDKIIKIFTTAERISLIKHCVWSISNFCRSKPAPDFELMKPAIDLVIKSIYKIDKDFEFLVDACWILSYLTEHHKKTVKKILTTNVLPKLLSFLEYPMVYIQLPCLRIVGNIVSGNAHQTQMVLDGGILQYLKKTIFNEKRSIRKESCWIVSNIAAGTQQQIEALITSDFLPILEYVIKNDEPEIQKEAIWAACNLTSIENKGLMEYILKHGILELICHCLKLTDAKYIAVSIEALSNLLNFGKQYYMVDGKNLILQKLEQLGMYDVLENLQCHPVEIVYEKTIKLLETYFETENQN